MQRKHFATSNSDAPPSLRRARTWKDAGLGFYDGLVKHRTTGLAAEVAFFALVSIPPTFLAFFGALGFVGDALGQDFTNSVRAEVILGARNFLTPTAVDQVVVPILDKTLTHGHFEILSIGLIAALFAASRAADALIGALNIVYDVDERVAMWRRRALAFVFTFVGIAAGAIVFPLLIAGPQIAHAVLKQSTITIIVDVLYWPVVGLVSVLALTTTYHFATPFRKRYRRDIPGAAFAFVLWVIGSAALRAYARWSVESNPMYGSLAAPMVVLAWLYFTSFAVLMGAEVNSVADILWPALSAKEMRRIVRDVVERMRARGADIEPVTASEVPNFDLAKADQVLNERAKSPAAERRDALRPPPAHEPET